MKIILFCVLCLLLIGCESEKISQEEYILSETKMTEDMQKIKELYVNRHKENSSDEGLEIAKVICEFYGKDNKRLDKELDKIHNDRYREVYDMEKAQEECSAYFRTFKSALKGLKLDCDQVLTLARDIEKVFAEIVANQEKTSAPYKAKAREILKSVQANAVRPAKWRERNERHFHLKLRNEHYL
ncbi:hypothetical protein FACS189472_11610 [Alphaproteobacteria bacterium]|nr:hypothetical protein FACS189472_11610 [Alphaproteobacteria bacterium]